MSDLRVGIKLFLYFGPLDTDTSAIVFWILLVSLHTLILFLKHLSIEWPKLDCGCGNIGTLMS